MIFKIYCSTESHIVVYLCNFNVLWLLKKQSGFQGWVVYEGFIGLWYLTLFGKRGFVYSQAEIKVAGYISFPIIKQRDKYLWIKSKAKLASFIPIIWADSYCSMIHLGLKSFSVMLA